MDELGHVLREARETKGLTLAEVEEKTRINRRFLVALENGAYHDLPTPVHVRGFLRNYARFLNLDPAPLLERYELVKQQIPDPYQNPDPLLPPISEPPELREAQPFFDPVNFQVDDGRRRDPQSLVRLFIILALIVFLGLVFSRLMPLITGVDSSSQPLTEGINEVLRSIINSNEQDAVTPDAVEDTNGIVPTQAVIQNPGSTGAQTTATPTRPALGTLDVINLRLDISERTWMEVTIDGDIRFSGFATRGDVFEWTAEEDVRLLTGNARGIIATINEVELGRLGSFQEAREEYWSTTN